MNRHLFGIALSSILCLAAACEETPAEERAQEVQDEMNERIDEAADQADEENEEQLDTIDEAADEAGPGLTGEAEAD